MNPHAELALANPVYDPERQILKNQFWRPDRFFSAGLTVNIGME